MVVFFSIIQLTICHHGSDNGLALKRRQSIICTNDGIVYWSIYASPGLNESFFTWLFMHFYSFLINESNSREIAASGPFALKREQTITQVVILILPLQPMFGSGKKGFPCSLGYLLIYPPQIVTVMKPMSFVPCTVLYHLLNVPGNLGSGTWFFRAIYDTAAW